MEYKSIKHWDVENRPREKVEKLGVSELETAELLAILINNGTKGKSALDIAHDILKAHQYNLSELGKLSLKQLKNFDGIGLAKAVTILAALEIGRRRRLQDALEKKIIGGSHDAYQCLAPYMEDLHQEEFWVIYLNNSNHILHIGNLNKGTTNQTIVDTKAIYRKALELNCLGIIIAHNHPSGKLIASEEDKKITLKIKQGLALIDLKLLDHLIITSNGYLSFADASML